MTNSPARSALIALVFAALPALGCRQILDIPEPVECGSDDACNTSDDPCTAGECIDGVCAYALKPAGTVVDGAGELDCKQNVCDENGDVVVAPDDTDFPADTVAGDCVTQACDGSGNLVEMPVDDAPADTTPGDCSKPACDGGVLTTAPADDDAPTTGDMPGDCVAPGCSGGMVVDLPKDDDPPADDSLGNCMSPSCDGGNVVEVVNERDAPAEDIDGDCLAPTCDAMGMFEPDDMDTPTSGCGTCENGTVVAWADEGQACYTGPVGTQNVGICIGGTWVCNDNVRECSGQRTPVNEACGPGFTDFDDDCDGETDEEGPGCNCQTGQTQACYTGPNGTVNVGICDEGVSTCTATMMGNQYGPCVGEVLPQTCDSCIVTGDQDCSGTASTCVGDHVWSKPRGSTGSENAYDVLQLPNGEVIMVGSFNGTLVSGSTIVSDGGFDAFWLRFDAEGNSINAKDWGGTGTDSARILTQLDDGYIVAGHLGDGSTENFGVSPTLTAVGQDAFVVKFNSNHTVAWKKLIGGTSTDTIEAVVRMPDNGIAVAGRFYGTINLGGSNLTSAGFDDIYLARFDAAGNHVWSSRFGSNMVNSVTDLAVGPSGELIMVGEYATGFSFGGPTLTVSGGVDSYVVKFDQNGVHQWTRAWRSTGNEYAQQAVVLSDGTVWVAGRYDTAVDLNGVAGAEATPTATGYDLLVVKYSSAGTYQTFKSVNSTSTVTVTDMELGFDDGIVMSGTYQGTFFTGQFALPSNGGTDAWMLKIHPTSGATLWGKKYGGASTDAYEGIDIGACGDVFAVGDYHNEAVNFGGGALPNEGSYDVFVAKYRQ